MNDVNDVDKPGQGSRRKSKPYRTKQAKIHAAASSSVKL
jgi:hypothetical protein